MGLATAAEITKAYQDTFGHAPDAAGLDYWSGQNVDNLGAALSAGAQGSDKAAAVNNYYENTFGRPADSGGVDYWSGQVASDPNWQSAVKSAASAEDKNAMSDMGTDNLTYSNTWDGNVNANDNNKYYDAAQNKWVTAPIAKSPFAQPATLQTTNYGENYVNPLSMASTQAANILKEGSPLLTQAQSRSNQQMNARGLSNSSMGNEAGTSAVTNVAAALGQDQAAQYGAAQRAAQQGDIASALSSQSYQQTANLAAQQNAFTTALNNAGYSQADTLALASMINSANSAAMSQIGSFINNVDIADKNAAINWVNSTNEAFWKSAASILGINIDVS